MTNFKGKTILITGGTGSFGEFFVDYLQEAGANASKAQ